ncbi:MAG TPA: sulfatase-like hydrolase/transferase, partial [Bradyrhizobium sp.]|nr:sulfatase-like hydrolase/transferase [Bradyrhizobium sp.]
MQLALHVLLQAIRDLSRRSENAQGRSGDFAEGTDVMRVTRLNLSFRNIRSHVVLICCDAAGQGTVNIARGSAADRDRGLHPRLLADYGSCDAGPETSNVPEAEGPAHSAEPVRERAALRRRAIPSPLTHPPVTLGSAASNERRSLMIIEQNRCRSKQGWLLATGLASLLITLPTLLAAQQITGTPGTPSATMTLDGKQLPPEPPKFGGVIKEDAKDSKPYWPPSVVPPKSAPNVLLIMTDDQGYGVSGTFGGVIPTPAMDRVANAGLRYTQFHSTALCSPTRAALITGRNHHSVGFGVIGELSTGYPGYDSVIGQESATIGTILRDNGFATSWFGKNHNTPTYLYSSAGPFDQWPVGMGFQYFYGFMGGETDQ